jgi:DHA1 family tetracycline resistance protein-like MFS transporter
LSDSYGRKKILFLSALGSTISWAFFIVALYLPIHVLITGSSGLTGTVILTLPLLCIFVARMVEGFTGGNISVANAYLADITTGAERKKDFGKMGIASNLGFIFGPMIAGVLGSTALGLTLPVLAAFATTLLGLILIWTVLPEPVRTHRTSTSDAQATMSFRAALQMPGIGLLLTICFVFYLAFSLFVVSFPLFAIDTMKWSVGSMGFFFSFLSIVLVITQGPLLTLLSKRFSAAILTIIGSVIVALSYIAITFTTTPLAYVGAALYGIGNGLMWPSFLSILSDQSGEEYQGYLQGLNSSAGSLASIIGLLAGGILYSVMHGNIFFIAAAMVGIVSLLSLKLPSLSAPAPQVESPQSIPTVQ